MSFWRRTTQDDPSGQRDRPLVFSDQLAGARRGDPESLGVLYRQFLPAIFGYIAIRVPERAIAEDLTSEVFLQMIEGIGQIRARDEASFAAWLLKIARITVAGYYRERTQQLLLVPLEPHIGEEGDQSESNTLPSTSPEADPARWAEARDEWRHVVEAINMLTEEQRQVLIGRLIMGYDFTTIARMIGKNTNAVKALQFRALHRLHHLLEKWQGTEQGHNAIRIPQKGKVL